MASRQPTIKVAQRWSHTDEKRRNVYQYIVQQTKNTTEPHVAEKLTKEQVDNLILQGYDVTIVPYTK